jgi:hypothetical protein
MGVTVGAIAGRTAEGLGGVRKSAEEAQAALADLMKEKARLDRNIDKQAQEVPEDLREGFKKRIHESPEYIAIEKQRRALQDQARARAETTRGIDLERKAIEQLAVADARAQRQKRLATLSEEDFGRQVKQTSKNLKDVETDLTRAQRVYGRLKEREENGMLTKADLRLSAPGMPLGVKFEHMPGYIRDLHEGHRAFQEEQEDLTAEAARRSAVPPGAPPPGKNPPSDGDGGSGGYFQAVANALGGNLLKAAAPPLAAAYLTVRALRSAWRYASEGAAEYQHQQELVFNTGMRLGGGFSALQREARQGLRGPLLLRHDETMAAKQIMGEETRTSDIRGVTAFARSHGMSVEQASSAIGAFGALGPIEPQAGPPPGLGPDEMALWHSGWRTSRGEPKGPPPPPAGLGPDETALWNRGWGRPAEKSDGGFSSVIAASYKRSAYANLPADEKLSQVPKYIQAGLSIAQAQTSGGAILGDNAPHLFLPCHKAFPQGEALDLG